MTISFVDKLMNPYFWGNNFDQKKYTIIEYFSINYMTFNNICFSFEYSCILFFLLKSKS